MSVPKWADKNLFADECALLEEGFDRTNPTHVVLLRLARERRGHQLARQELHNLRPKDYGVPTEKQLEYVRDHILPRLEERRKNRPEPCPECTWEPVKDGDTDDFPWLQCPVCKCRTWDEGPLWEGARGSSSDCNRAGPKSPR